MDIIGLDIGTRLIKAVEIRREKGVAELLNYSYAPSFKESLLSEASIDAKNFSKNLREFLASSSIKSANVIASFPESHVFTRVIEVPKMSSKELEKAVYWEAEHYLPVSIESVDINFQVLPNYGGGENGKKTEILLVAAQKDLLKRFVKVLDGAGLVPLGLEPESMSLARSVFLGESQLPVTVIVNLGSDATGISVVADNYIRFTRNIGTGGKSIKRALSQDLGFEEKQAEEYIKTYGMDETQMEGKIRSSIKPIVDVILNEVRKSIAFFETKGSGRKVKRVVLCGGNAIIPGMLLYAAQFLNLEVQLANPWQKLKIREGLRNDKFDEVAPIFAGAVGAALKDVAA